MTSKPSSKKSSVAGTATLIGGLAAAAAVGGYFLYNNKDAQKKIKKVRGWALKAKGEVLQKIENLKTVNEEIYHKVIDTVLSRYQKVSNIDAGEIIQISKELKSHWKSIQNDLAIGKTKVSNVIKKVVDAGIKNKEVAKRGTKSVTKKSTEKNA